MTVTSLSAVTSRELHARYRAAGAWQRRTIAQRVAELAAEHPGREAVVDQTQRVTYGELLAQSMSLAAFLRDARVGPGDRVAVQSGNRVELAVGHLACGLAGATFVPLSDAWRETELRHILAVSEAVVAIVPAPAGGHDFLSVAQAIRGQSPALRLVAAADGSGDFDLPAVLGTSAGPLPAAGDPDLPRYVMVSSGTTNVPKLSLWTDNNLCYFGEVWSRAVALSYKDRVVGLAPAGTGAIGYVFGILFPLLRGATSVLLERWEPTAALALIAAERATVVTAVPTQLVKLLDAPSARDIAFPHLRVVANAGAPMPPDAAARLERTWDCRIQNVYGATDGGVPLMTRIEDPAPVRLGTVGRPVPLTDIRLRDASGDEARPGEPGEIHWRGPTKTFGYLGDPARTAEMFTADGYYRSGDLAQADADGNFRIVGRAKDMIIRGGQNISPREIEEAVLAHPAVGEAVAVGLPDPVYGERVCVAVTLRDGGRLDLPALNAFLATRRMAKFKLPERLECFDELPRTVTGKLGKEAVRRLVLERSVGDDAAVG
jgi:non-ribosomal peptide synthetase component E (peptide arylation enzyme)